MRGLVLTALLLATAAAASESTASVSAIAAQIDAGYCQRALGLLQPLLKAEPHSAALQLQQGRALLGAGRVAEARSVLEAAIAEHPEHAALHRVLGETYGAAAETAGPFDAYRLARATLGEFQKAVALAPADADSHLDLGQFYLQAPAVVGGGLDKAQAESRELDRLSPLMALQLRATEAEQDHRSADAERYLQQAVTLDASDDSRYLLGHFYLDAQRPQEAERVFRTLTEKSPATPEAYYWLGTAAAQAHDDITEGIAALRRYLGFSERPDRAPSPAWAHLRLGALYQLNQHPDLARSELQAARQQTPPDDQAFAAELDRLSGLL